MKGLDKPDHQVDAAEPTALGLTQVASPQQNSIDVDATIRYPNQQQLNLLSSAWRTEQNLPARPPKGHASRMASRLVFTLLIANLGLLLIQTLYFWSANLSEVARYRPALETICGLIGCPIAERRALGLIGTDAFIITVHPSVKEALLIDLVLSNNADFAQPFPALKLRFSDVKGQIVAQRIFLPSEYLVGPMKTIARMSSSKSYRIKLSILNPGKKAVSYSLTLAG
jgi:hypothetical protein